MFNSNSAPAQDSPGPGAPGGSPAANNKFNGHYWPSPPFAIFNDAVPWTEPQLCEIEDLKGVVHSCRLALLTPSDKTVMIFLPKRASPGRMHFSRFRRLTLKTVLHPEEEVSDTVFLEIFEHRPTLDYQLQLADGKTVSGKTVGYIELDFGLFLFTPVDGSRGVERVFIPREAYSQASFGEQIGHLLVTQRAVTRQQVELAASEQQNLRNRKLGDHLIGEAIISPEQLMMALDQQSRLPKIPVGEALIRLGFIDGGQLAKALEKQKTERSMPLGQLLVNMGFLTRRELKVALAQKMGYPVVDVTQFPIEADALRMVPFSTALRLGIMPLLLRDKMLVVATADPTRREVLDELEFMLSMRVIATLGEEQKIQRTLSEIYEKFGLSTEALADRQKVMRSEAIVSPSQLMTALDQQSRMPMIPVGEALTRLGFIDEEQLAKALERQKTERSIPLGQLLVNMGFLTRRDLNTALAHKMGYPVVDVTQFPIEADALRTVPFSTALRLGIMPLLLRDKMLVVATADPTRREVLDELEFMLSMRVIATLGEEQQIQQMLSATYERFGLSTSALSDSRQNTPNLPEASVSTSELLQSMESSPSGQEEAERQIEQSDNTLVRLINTMIIEAHDRGVSDIHVETHPGRAKTRIRFRKDGVMSPYLELPNTYRSALTARLKIMADLDISERRKPQDGKIDFSKFSARYRIELRIATIPTYGGLEDVVMRLLSSAKPISMDKLGLSVSNLTRLREAVSRPYGMVLCVGPTGSGKTTTLHSVLGYLNTPQRKIWTAEDPIEITQPDLRQVQVNPKIDWTFAKALRSFLRADPDVIMVGEIRDKETVQIAIEASLTGHLVLSTLHTNSAAETVTRLIDMGMDPFSFADSLLAVLAQRLVRRICPECRVAQNASEAVMDELLNDYLHAFPEALRPAREQVRQEWLTEFGHGGHVTHYTAPGCNHCQFTGVNGRVGMHELLLVTPSLRRLIQTGARPEQLQFEAMQHGFLRTLRQDGIQKVLSGLTSIEEVRANSNIL